MLANQSLKTPIQSYESARLRWANLRDSAALVALYNLARVSQEETQATMQDWLEQGGALILENTKGELVCAIRWREAQNGWFVDRIATAPDARGQGYGRWLMTKVEALAIRRNIPTLTLTLDEVRDDLTHYYQRMGYQVLEQTPCEITMNKRVGGMWQYK